MNIPNLNIKLFLLFCVSILYFVGCSISKGNVDTMFAVYLSKIKDSVNTSSTAATNTQPNVLSVTPANNTVGFIIGTPITISFDKAIDTSTLTMISTDGLCTGNIQLSTNNFTSCLGGILNISTDQMIASISLQTSFCVESSDMLQIKVLSGVKDTLGNALASSYSGSTSFQTQQAVLKVGALGGTTVKAMAVSCNILFIGGDFTSVGSSARNRIAAIDLVNGFEIPTWNPNADNTVNTIALNGNTVYVGGTFLNIGGQARSRIAALDIVTGQATSWNPNANNTVNTIAISNNLAYVGGSFNGGGSIGGQPRSRIAAIDLNTGIGTAWDPNCNNGVINIIAVSGNVAYVGGTFAAANIGGQTNRNYLVAVDLSTGLTLPGWCATGAVSPVNTIVATSTDVLIAGSFVGGLCGTTFNNFGSIQISTGNATPGFASGVNTGTNNITNAIAISGSNIYVGGAFTGAASFVSLVRNYIGATDLTGNATAWNPNANNVVNTIITLGTAVLIGGNFTSVNGGTVANRIAIIDINTGVKR